MERGRDLEQVLNQYMNFVKPAFEEFCLPVSQILVELIISYTLYFSTAMMKSIFDSDLFGWLELRSRTGAAAWLHYKPKSHACLSQCSGATLKLYHGFDLRGRLDHCYTMLSQKTGVKWLQSFHVSPMVSETTSGPFCLIFSFPYLPNLLHICLFSPFLVFLLAYKLFLQYGKAIAASLTLQTAIGDNCAVLDHGLLGSPHSGHWF